MMLGLLYVAGVLLAAVAVILVVASLRPDSFRVERSMEMAAAPERVYPEIADLKAMNTWNPFVDPDPAIQITYSGADAGKGAVHTWKGNRHVGEGRLEILDAAEPSRLDMRLQMFKPFKADNAVAFTLAPAGAGTRVTWAMSGRQPLMAKVMSMFIDCDRMVGGQFEKGLSSLKAKVEA